MTDDEFTDLKGLAETAQRAADVAKGIWPFASSAASRGERWSPSTCATFSAADSAFSAVRNKIKVGDLPYLFTRLHDAETRAIPVLPDGWQVVGIDQLTRGLYRATVLDPTPAPPVGEGWFRIGEGPSIPDAIAAALRAERPCHEEC